jgi:hypothetical protein
VKLASVCTGDYEQTRSIVNLPFKDKGLGPDQVFGLPLLRANCLQEFQGFL